MCGRFYDVFDLDDITTRFRVSRPLALPLPLRYNIAPTQPAAVVRETDGGRELALLRWGLIPRWAKDQAIGSRMINARAETLKEKPSFKDAYAARRLIVPVSGFFEWQRDGERKLPFAIRRPNRAPLPLAGLWEAWHDLETFTIITTAANAAMRPVHERMPLILKPSEIDAWLDPENPDPEDVLASRPTEELELVPVSTWVNSPSHDDPRCLQERAP